jgi:hypothetical protein
MAEIPSEDDKLSIVDKIFSLDNRRYTIKFVILSSVILTGLFYIFSKIELDITSIAYFLTIIALIFIFLVTSIVEWKRGNKTLKIFFRDENQIENYYKVRGFVVWGVSALIILIIMEGTKSYLQIPITEFNNDVLNALVTLASDIMYGAQFFFITFTLESLSYLFLSFSKNEFKYEFARKSAELSERSSVDETERTKYILIAIRWYDNYIRGLLHIHIKNKDRTINKIIKLLHYDNQILNEISSDLKQDYDKLKLMKSLEYKFRDRNEDYFTEYTSFERIKGMSEFTIPIVTVIISIIGITINNS